MFKVVTYSMQLFPILTPSKSIKSISRFFFVSLHSDRCINTFPWLCILFRLQQTVVLKKAFPI